MQSRNRKNQRTAVIGAWWSANVVLSAKAFHYACAAQRDERNGFPYTAAMEWRKAAELFPSKTRAAEYSWRKWERIMLLPRRLAGPVGNSQQASCPLAPASRPAMTKAINKNSFAGAA